MESQETKKKDETLDSSIKKQSPGRKGSFNTPRKVGTRKFSDHTFDKELLNLEPELKLIDELTLEGK